MRSVGSKPRHCRRNPPPAARGAAPRCDRKPQRGRFGFSGSCSAIGQSRTALRGQTIRLVVRRTARRNAPGAYIPAQACRATANGLTAFAGVGVQVTTFRYYAWQNTGKQKGERAMPAEDAARLFKLWAASKGFVPK